MSRKTRRDGDTIWVYWTEYSGQRLITRQELQPWIDAMIDGVGPDGVEVGAVNFVFSDVACATYNHDSLSFARVQVYLDGDPPRRLNPDGAPTFEAREDFGMPVR